VVLQWLWRQTRDPDVVVLLSRNNPGQVVHTHVPLLPSKMYARNLVPAKGHSLSNTLRLGRSDITLAMRHRLCGRPILQVVYSVVY